MCKMYHPRFNVLDQMEECISIQSTGSFFMLFCYLMIFSISTSIRNTISLNSMYSDQAQHFVGPDLDPNCLQNLSDDDT